MVKTQSKIYHESNFTQENYDLPKRIKLNFSGNYVIVKTKIYPRITKKI